MKFLVLGCNGMAGHMISLYLKEQGHIVIGFDRTPSKYIDSIIGDARDLNNMNNIIVDGQFDSVINAIGILNQFADEDKELSTFLNSYFPHYLAKITERSSTQIIHLSTDCVFSGKRGDYSEDDIRDGDSFYDRSKAIGELEDSKNITIRTSIVGPDLNPQGIGLMNWFMQQKSEIEGYTLSFWTGQTTLQLAKTMEAAAKMRAHGLYNMVPESKISKCELLVLFNRYFRDNKVIINPISGLKVDKSLIRTRYDFSYRIPSYDTMFSELSFWMKSHKDMYNHYYK